MSSTGRLFGAMSTTVVEVPTIKSPGRWSFLPDPSRYHPNHERTNPVTGDPTHHYHWSTPLYLNLGSPTGVSRVPHVCLTPRRLLLSSRPWGLYGLEVPVIFSSLFTSWDLPTLFGDLFVHRLPRVPSLVGRPILSLCVRPGTPVSPVLRRSKVSSVSDPKSLTPRPFRLPSPVDPPPPVLTHNAKMSTRVFSDLSMGCLTLVVCSTRSLNTMKRHKTFKNPPCELKS